MSNFLHLQLDTPGASSVSVSIPEAFSEDGATFYTVQVNVTPVQWTVKRRFKEFASLHTDLVECGVAKESLPEKKILGNKDPAFIMKRRRELETYLVGVLSFLERALPEVLADFLHLTHYDISHVLGRLAAEHHDWMETGKELDDDAWWSPLEMFAISTRLKTPLPPQDPSMHRTDFVNVADRACQLRSLLVTGSNNPLGTSDIIPNKLKWDLHAFKSLTKLVLTGACVNPETITALARTRATLKDLQMNSCKLKSVAQALLCDTAHYSLGKEDDRIQEEVVAQTNEGDSTSRKWEWQSLEKLSLRNNEIPRLDASLQLAPKLKSLILDGNHVEVIENISHLENLDTLHMADNCVSDVTEFHSRLHPDANLTTINLSDNRLKCLLGLWQMQSLHELNAAANRVAELDSALMLASLRKLTWLNLQGNPVTAQVDYRLKVFEGFGKRCSELCLDNESPSQSEVDKVSVLMALRVAREGKEPTALFGNLPRRVNK